MMKYFTRKWVDGSLSDEEMETTAQAYAAHLKSLIPRLPGPLIELASGPNLHDGLIRRVEVNKNSASLFVGLICGDLEDGYADIDLLYSGVDVAKLDLPGLAALARDRRTEILRTEIDQPTNGVYEHRLLFWPNGELTVRFEGVSFSKRPRDDRSIAYIGDPYGEVDKDGQ